MNDAYNKDLLIVKLSNDKSSSTQNRMKKFKNRRNHNKLASNITNQLKTEYSPYNFLQDSSRNHNKNKNIEHPNLVQKNSIKSSLICQNLLTINSTICHSSKVLNNETNNSKSNNQNQIYTNKKLPTKTFRKTSQANHLRFVKSPLILQRNKDKINDSKYKSMNKLFDKYKNINDDLLDDLLEEKDEQIMSNYFTGYKGKYKDCDHSPISSKQRRKRNIHNEFNYLLGGTEFYTSTQKNLEKSHIKNSNNYKNNQKLIMKNAITPKLKSSKKHSKILSNDDAKAFLIKKDNIGKLLVSQTNTVSDKGTSPMIREFNYYKNNDDTSYRSIATINDFVKRKGINYENIYTKDKERINIKKSIHNSNKIINYIINDEKENINSNLDIDSLSIIKSINSNINQYKTSKINSNLFSNINSNENIHSKINTKNSDLKLSKSPLNNNNTNHNLKVDEKNENKERIKSAKTKDIINKYTYTTTQSPYISPKKNINLSNRNELDIYSELRRLKNNKLLLANISKTKKLQLFSLNTNPEFSGNTNNCKSMRKSSITDNFIFRLADRNECIEDYLENKNDLQKFDKYKKFKKLLKNKSDETNYLIGLMKKSQTISDTMLRFYVNTKMNEKYTLKRINKYKF